MVAGAFGVDANLTSADSMRLTVMAAAGSLIEMALPSS